MPRSMTGFGRCFVEDERAAQEWEIRSVNSRYLDLKWRLPQMARYLEPAFEKIVRRYAQRGRVEVSLALRFAPGHAPRLDFDSQQADAMLNALARLAADRGDAFSPDYSRFLDMPNLWGDPGAEEVDELAAGLERGLALALEDWNESRQAEGESLARDLEGRILALRQWTAELDGAAPRIREERVQALRERVAQALESAAPDEDRLLQEVVILTDRLDVSEELTRLAAHLGRLLELLRGGRDVGRKLDFTLQECFREINTCGNKIPDADLSRIVVDFKNELEKCREQAQNLE